jgi:uncharacterized Fe-S cluster-containing radical SAM superfamily protein
MPKKTEPGYDPIALAAATEKVVVAGNRRKYANLARPLRFYGGTTSATEVGCNLRCAFCFSDKPVRKPGKTGRFYTPQQVFDALDQNARQHGHKLISASASEGTMGREHLIELLELVDQSQYVFVLETNGLSLGHDRELVRELAHFRNLHVRVSIKGTNANEYHRLTGARPSSYELPFKAIESLIEEGVSMNACLMASFSTDQGIREVRQRLSDIRPGLLLSLEIEFITLFPKVAQRLRKEGLKPNRIRHRGRVLRRSTKRSAKKNAGAQKAA